MHRTAELYLSSVLNREIISPTGENIGKLWDVAIAPGENFPVVTDILLKKGKRIITVAWEKVVLFNPVVVSVNGDIAKMPDYDASRGTILIKRDIFDKQIVDVNGAKVVRVNDVKLSPHENVFCLYSVDIGLGGMLRRLGYERFWLLFRKEIPTKEISWKYVNTLEINASGLTLSMAREQLADMHPADIANIILNLPRQSTHNLLDNLDHETAGEAIHELEPELRTQIFTQLNERHASDILEEMSPDEAADVLGDLPEEKAQELLKLMDRDEAEEIQELMVYDNDTAGGLMNSEFVSVPADMKISSIIAEIRRQSKDIETIYYAYVLDGDERLVGIVSIRDLLLGDPHTPVSEIMTEQLKTVEISAEPDDILSVLVKYNLVAVPVINDECRMVGIVTVDDVIERVMPYQFKRKLAAA